MDFGRKTTSEAIHIIRRIIEAGDKVELRLTRSDTLHRLMEFDILGYSPKPPSSQN